MTGLHATRLEGGNLNRLRSELAALQQETAQIRNESGRLMTMLTLAGQDQDEVVRRVGAIESTLPRLLETPAAGPGIDNALLTSGIGDENRQFAEAEGGSVAYTIAPIGGAAETPVEPGETETEPESAAKAEAVQAMPQPTVSDAVIADLSRSPRIIAAPAKSFGIALGPQVTVQDAYLAWKDITNKAGTLLLGLGPLLSGNAGVEQQRLVAGPIDDYAQAEQICIRMIRMGISCLPVPYAGRALPD